MKLFGILVVVGAMLTPLGADTVTWRATGEVTGVTTAGAEGFAPLGIMNGQKVEVEFSYDDLAGGKGIRDFTAFGWLVEWEYFGNIDLEVRIKIDSHVWEGVVGTATQGTPYTLWVQDMFSDDIKEDEFLVATVSDVVSEGGTFASFPGKSATGESSLSINLRDAEFPYWFLITQFLPRATEPRLEELTVATGEVRSGDESISFAIDPRSIVIADGPAGEPEEPSILVVGGEVTLGWAAEVGADYTIRWSENGRQWGVLTVVTADAVDETHTFSPFGAPAAQFFQVSRND